MVVILLGNYKIHVNRKGRCNQDSSKEYSEGGFFVVFNSIILFQRLEHLKRLCSSVCRIF